MNLFTRRYRHKDKLYNLSLWEIWKKIHISNEYSTLIGSNFLWKVSTKFQILFRLCFACYAIVLIILYTVFVIDLTIEPSGNLFYIFLNLLIMILPLFLTELALTLFVPLDVLQNIEIKEIGNSKNL